jgi:hypothetical protein
LVNLWLTYIEFLMLETRSMWVSTGVFAENRSGSGIGGSTLSVSDLEVIFEKNCDAYKFANISFYQRVAFNVLLSANGVDKSTIATESGNVIRMMFSPNADFAKLAVDSVNKRHIEYSEHEDPITVTKAEKTLSDNRNEDNPLAYMQGWLRFARIERELDTTKAEKFMNQKTVAILKSFLTSKDSIHGIEAYIRVFRGNPGGLNSESERLLKSVCD